MNARVFSRARRLISGGSAPRWLPLAAAALLIAATACVALLTRHTADRGQQVQVRIERVRTATKQIGVLFDVGRASSTQERLTAYSQLNTALAALRQADDGAATQRLERDATALYNSASGTPRGALAAFRALEDDSVAAAVDQQGAAAEASTRAAVAFVASEGLAILALLALGLRLRRGPSGTVGRRRAPSGGEERLRALIEHSSDIITVIGSDLVVRWQSPSGLRILGHPAAEVAGKPLTDFVFTDDGEVVTTKILAVTRREGTITFTARFVHADRTFRHLEVIAENRLADSTVEGIILSMRDISERQSLEDELRHQAFHDALTGLANRPLFEDRLTHALTAARRHGRQLAVLFLDLDDFKTINDSLGHSAGDQLLRAVARRIASVVRASDTAARLGGDEFAVLLDTMSAESDADMIAGRLLDALRAPIEVSGRELRITASIGLAKGDGSLAVDDLLRNADTAMYAAKASGKNMLQSFEAGMHRRAVDRLDLTGELRRGLKSGEFELEYQPIVALDSGQTVGVEALVRWQHPTRGRLSPDKFIPLAEETGLIIDLGNWIVETACAQAAAWREQLGDESLYMNVNVSTRQLHDPAFSQSVAAMLADTGLPARALVLEITESLLPEDGDDVVAHLRALKDHGVRIAVDDFGTGYSALSRLQSYPVDILKIDRSFIKQLGAGSDLIKLVRGIVNLGQSLGLEVVVEGIETEEQAALLRTMHAAFGQGYLFSRPLPRAEIEATLAAGEPLIAPAVGSVG